jgi:hypothetical protein
MKSFFRNILPASIILILIAVSCSGRKNRAERTDLIPEQDLVPVLTDIYMTDALLTIPKINRNYAGTDSIAAYKQVIESHGYSQDQFNRTIRFYFIKKPKRFIKIYDKVLAGLSEMDSRIDKERPIIRPDQANLWEGRSFYNLSGNSDDEDPEVNFQVPYSGFFTIKFTLTIYPDDHVVSPNLNMYVYSADSVDTGKKHYFFSLRYIKDGFPHTYKSILIIRNPARRLFVKGWFFETQCIDPATMGPGIIIENIMLTRSIAE